MLPHPNQGCIEYLIQNVIDAGIVSSREEFAKMVRCSVNELKGYSYVDEDFGKKLKKIIPGYNVGWWMKGNKSKSYLTEDEQKTADMLHSSFKSRLAQTIKYSKECGYFSSEKDFGEEFIKPIKTIQKDFEEVYKTIACLKNRIPHLNEKWLLFGEGDMFEIDEEIIDK